MKIRKEKQRAFEVDRGKRNERRNKLHHVEKTHMMVNKDGDKLEHHREFETCPEHAEARQIVVQLARSFIDTIEFYKSERGGSQPHDEAVKQAMSLNEWRREYVEGLQPEKIEWNHIAAVGEHNLNDALSLWTRVRDAAGDELESGMRAAKIAGDSAGPYARAQFLAIRDAFADQWQPQGGIESAMIDMLTLSFSLQMYWATVAHERAMHTHDEQCRALQGFESDGWKSPYQSAAQAIEQANRLADGYNRQFLRVLRHMRDLRRYTPPVIVNNGGQVNVGQQQVNIAD